MSQNTTKDSSQYIDNKEHDSLLLGKRVIDVGTDDKTIIDESGAPATTYTGRAGRGVATSSAGWLLTKIAVSGTTTTITHAIDSWDNRLGATYS